MGKNIGFKITVEFNCSNMIDEKTFREEFNSDVTKAYKFISDNFSDNPSSFSNKEKIIKIELLS